MVPLEGQKLFNGHGKCDVCLSIVNISSVIIREKEFTLCEKCMGLVQEFFNSVRKFNSFKLAGVELAVNVANSIRKVGELGD